MKYLILFTLLFLVCTPLGFVRLFGVVGQVLVKPHLLRDVDEEFHAFYLEEASVLRKLEHLQNNTKAKPMFSTTTTMKSIPSKTTSPSSVSSSSSSTNTKYCDINTIPKSSFLITNDNNLKERSDIESNNGIRNRNQNSIYNRIEADKLHERLSELKSERKELDKLRKSTSFQRNLIYPLAMLLLLFLTGITVLIVVQNTLELLIGIKALPLSTRVSSK